METSDVASRTVGESRRAIGGPWKRRRRRETRARARASISSDSGGAAGAPWRNKGGSGIDASHGWRERRTQSRRAWRERAPSGSGDSDEQISAPIAKRLSAARLCA
ncbi:hypothetical protein KM043_001407 [Ampulex compressa]|nr:hypothetical protein KM043_001407 [Ampulex compressa]